MKNRSAALLLLAFLPACTTASLAMPEVGRTPSAAELERQSFELVNRRRSREGLAPLIYDEAISAIAREHSRSMAGGDARFGHDGFRDRVAAVRRIEDVGAAAENVAYDSRTGPALARLVVDGWMASPPHREAIEGAYDATGVGVAVAPDGTRYFTEIFVDRTG